MNDSSDEPLATTIGHLRQRIADLETSSSILDSILDCIITMDAHGKVIGFNAASERTFGYTKAEAIGHTLADLIIPPRLRDAHAAGLALYRATGEGPLIGKLVEMTAMRSDASEILVELAITAAGNDEAPIFTGVLRDITERSRAEEQYHQAQKMEAIGRLAGGVAHDFNNLLTVILGYCELLLADLDPGDPRHADLAEIEKAGVQAAGLTRQLLVFSRKQIVEPTRLDLNLVVIDMRAMLGRLIREDVRVMLGLRPDLAPVTADRGQVEQIIMNLAVNAQDAMPNGGTLTLETANIELGELYAASHVGVRPGQYVALTVTDTGTGITPQVQARLFEPFFTTKEAGRGTGLGLATVHAIVTQSGGSVSVVSEVGKGTSFSVYFPRVEAAEVVAEAPPPVARPHAGAETVLVVEDAEELRPLTRRLLQRHGYTVMIAANADEAFQLFERNPSIDILLTDVVMPGGSGPELTRRLVERWPGLKVIYMSGYTDEAIAQHNVLRPGIAFLHKPFTSEVLLRKLREVLDR